jgi:hypothetical protein
MLVAARQWRQLAQKAAERQNTMAGHVSAGIGNLKVIAFSA